MNCGLATVMLNRTGSDPSVNTIRDYRQLSGRPPGETDTSGKQISPARGGILTDLQQSASASTEHDNGPKFGAPHRSWPVRTNIESTPGALEDLFSRLASGKPPKPIAVISGGSLSGCSTALELANDGYQVIIAEKRASYTRQNVLSLKTDAMLYLASLSPDGSLLRDMVRNRLVTPCTHEIVADPNSDTGYKAVPNASVRFLNWLVAEKALRPQIPVRDRRADLHAQVQAQDLAGLDDRLRRKPNGAAVEALDLAWPRHEPVTAVSPGEWQAPPAEFFGSENLVLAQVCDLEKSLNTCCLAHPSIHIVNAAIELQGEPNGEQDYHPVFKLGTGDDQRTFSPRQNIGLICLAEGASSPNRMLVGGELPPVVTNESWHQGNYVGPSADIGGFNAVDLQDDTIIVTQHIQRPAQSLVNVSVFHPTDQPPPADDVVNKLHRARAHVNSANVPVEISENHRIYDSGPIGIQLRTARNPMRRNVLQVGDNAISGSPGGGYGGSVGTSQFCQLVNDTVNHPDFNSPDPALRHRVEDYYRKGVADIQDVRTGRPTEILHRLGAYSHQTVLDSGRQAALARFDGLARIDLPPPSPENQR